MSNTHTLEPLLLDDAADEIAAAKREMEVAVDKILTVAEGLIARENASDKTGDSSLEADCFAIFEACAFQDIAGQRLSKAIGKIRQANDIREAKTRNQTLWAKPSADNSDNRRGEEGLLNGPALPGKGLDQAAVNLLLKSREGK